MLKRKLIRLVNQKISAQQDLAYYFDPYELPSESSTRRIWYTAENVRPPLHLPFDLFLSFDSNDYGGRNLRLPYWYFDLGIFNTGFNSRLGIETSMNNFLRKRTYDSAKHLRFANIVATNRSVLRDFVSSNFHEFEVDAYGKNFGRSLKSKSELKDLYKFTIAFENDFFPGYVTEKLPEAYALGSIPIYWGGLSEDKSINLEAIIDYSRFNSHFEFIEFMRSLSQNDIRVLYEQPLLLEPISLTPLIEKIKNLIY